MGRPLFRIAGIPVSVDVWFLVGLWVFYTLSGGGRAGMYTAVALALFVLIHELGHALLARRFGCQVEIRLAFLVGWASYSSPRALSQRRQHLISLAGPGAQLAAGVLALAVLRMVFDIESPDVDARLYIDLFTAVSWSGIILAVLNLLPLWPLDGGHVVEGLLRGRWGRSGHRAMLRWTLAACAIMGVAALTRTPAASAVADWAGRLRAEAFVDPLPLAVAKLVALTPAVALVSTVFIPLFCALGALQALQADRFAGAPSAVVDGYLSRLGDPGRRWLVDDIARPQIGQLLPLVPDSVQRTPAVVAARRVHGSVEDFVAAATETFHGHPGAEAFYVVAEGLADRGLPDEALQWLAAAVERHPDPLRLSTSPHFAPLHGRSEFQQLRGVAERAAPGFRSGGR